MTTSDLHRFRFNNEDILRLPARTEEFTTLRNWLDRIADELDITQRIRYQILVAVDEVFTNIAHYAYPTDDKPAQSDSVTIEVLFDRSTSCLFVVFTDFGIPFNPLNVPTPNLNVEPEVRPIGGLGIFLVRHLMDVVEYERKENRNILTVRKFLNENKG